MLSLDSFRSGWDFGLVFFGLHLLIAGYLVFRSGYFPKFLCFLIVIAGLGYLADSAGKLVLPDYSLSVAAFTFFGEVLLIVWMFLRGIRGFGVKGGE